MTDRLPPQDQAIRDQALDPAQSFIVQAPAGSGKTELLVTRFVTLLAQVRHPEQVLAITFTVKAAQEMRQRVILALESIGKNRQSTISPALAQVAEQAIEQDREQQWLLLRNPSRLKIMTIDSFNAQLVRKAPLYTGLSGQRTVTGERNVYRQAANGLLATLQNVPEEEQSLDRVFRHYGCDGRSLEKILMKMLATREQWLTLFTRLRNQQPENLQEHLNQQLEQQCQYLCQRMEDILHQWLEPLCEMARWVTTTTQPKEKYEDAIACIAKGLPETIEGRITFWRAIQTWLLKADKTLIGTITKAHGFPTNHPQHKESMLALLENMDSSKGIHVLQEPLPPTRYSDSQIQMLLDFADTFVEVAAWLELTFAEHKAIDFSGLGQKALDALGTDDAPDITAEQAYDAIHHILIDEFQDTSGRQIELLRRLIRDWSPESGDRSVFIVGDPKQSIYRFRQAEPGLFFQVWQHGIEHIQPIPLVLQSNFRSDQQLVTWYNAVFTKLFPTHPDHSLGETTYSESTAEKPASSEQPVLFFTSAKDEDAHQAIIGTALTDEIQQFQRNDDIHSIAILTKTKKQAAKCIEQLQRQQIAYSSIDIEKRSQQQHIMDLLSLARALADEQDAVSWLALLRHPAMGITLPDVLILCDGKQTIWQAIINCPDMLSDDGKVRIAILHSALEPIMRACYRSPWLQLIEDAWYAIGMEATLSTEHTQESKQCLQMFARHIQGSAIDFRSIEQSLEDSSHSGGNHYNSNTTPVFIMTIHKAKGLEFDVVLLPFLEGSLSKRGDTSPPPFLWDNIIRPDGNSLLLAHYRARTETENNALYQYLTRLEQRKSLAELLRLLYVACTRAKKYLRLFACISSTQQKENGNSFAQWLLHQAQVTPIHLAAQSLPNNLDDQSPTEAQPLPILTRYPHQWNSDRLGRHRHSSHIADSVSTERRAANQERTISAIQGIEIHHLLHQISSYPNIEQHIANQQSRDAFIEQYQQQWQQQLQWRGIAIDHRERISRQLIRAVTNIIQDATGRWILCQEKADNELSVQTINDTGTIITRIIDRTFISNNTRWIIDYKAVSQPSEETEQQFIDRIRHQYHAQLEQYASIIYAKEKRPIRLGLYLLLQPIWIDWHWSGNS